VFSNPFPSQLIHEIERGGDGEIGSVVIGAEPSELGWIPI